MTEVMEKREIDINEMLEKAESAAAIFSQLDQAHTDRIVRAVYLAGMKNRVKLARMAHDETGIGKWEDKVIKNVIGTQYIYENIKHLKTAGIIAEDEKNGIIEIAQPIGPILAITPVTNPTSTVMFKILIALKTRNPIIISPHTKAVKCSCEAAKICYEAALANDAPEDCIQWIEHTAREKTQTLMRHPKLSLIIATGGGGLVKEAYSSGTPAIGVGAGNVPVFIEKSADIPFAVEQIILSKTFDNGTVCASEQFLVVEKSIADRVIEELKKQKSHILSDEEIRAVEKIAFDEKRGLMNAEVVGRSAQVIACMAGITIPEDTVMLIAPLKGIGKEHPLSSEILAPILSFYIANGFDQAANLCIELNFYGGMGHTVSIFSNDENKMREFALLMNAGRIVVNTPSSQGGVGGTFNTLDPSLTLGCGTAGKNITTDNITARHLINIQRIAKRRLNERMVRFDSGLYMDETVSAEEIEKEFNRNY